MIDDPVLGVDNVAGRLVIGAIGQRSRGVADSS